MSDRSWESFERFVKRITVRDEDGRLKLTGHSKWTKPFALRVWNELTGHYYMTKQEVFDQIEQFLNETDGEAFFQEMKAENGALDLRVKANPELIATLAEQMSLLLEEQGAGNYCEWQFQSGKTGKGYTLLVQRKSGKTPAQRFNALKADLQDVVSTWSTLPARNTISKKQAAGVLAVILEEHK